MVKANGTLRFLPQKHLLDFIGSLMKIGEVYAPKMCGPVVDMRKIDHPNDVKIDFEQTRQSIRTIVEPQNEVLLTYDAKIGSNEKETKSKHVKRIILWSRPCDARALNSLDDNFYDKPFEDPYYSRRRENLIIIGLGCNEPFPYCFCSSMGGDPFSRENLDILMTQIVGGYMLESLTDKGQEIERHSENLLKTPSEEQIAKMKGIQEKAKTEIRRKTPNIPEVSKKMVSQFESPLWKKWGEKCIGCGICTYSCPTCWCFDITDTETKGKGFRMRSWDSCQFPLFTLHTSGHNPRPDKASRVRQRVMHKFSYHPTNYDGHIACVGCGRCSELCPMDIDLVAILEDVSKAGEKNA